MAGHVKTPSKSTRSDGKSYTSFARRIHRLKVPGHTVAYRPRPGSESYRDIELGHPCRKDGARPQERRPGPRIEGRDGAGVEQVVQVRSHVQSASGRQPEGLLRAKIQKVDVRQTPGSVWLHIQNDGRDRPAT